MSDKDINQNGIQGSTGYQGLQGVQGKMGLPGVQGAQGRIGIQGIQGRAGSRGFAGPIGMQGVQGIQGPTGFPGVQGTRGCVGIQGISGMVGVQGAQGKAGRVGSQGLMGIQGLPGVQGVQGTRGKIGDRGYMGYQGSDGPVGIQGLTGEKGHIWVDGISLDGYNTHLFEFNGEKFVSEKEDKLYLRDGAVIKIWLDEAGYDSIKSNNAIMIDNHILDNSLSTAYPALYADGERFIDRVNKNTDINSIIEFTFRGGAWYYSGGLNTSAITDDIQVSGVSFGNIKDGDVIKSGTTVQEILAAMFSYEIKTKVGAMPGVKITLTSNKSTTVEVGETYTNTLKTNFSDGYFVSSDLVNYPNEKFNANNGTANGRLTAGCNVVSAKYYENGLPIDSNMVSISPNNVTSYNYGVEVEYSESNNRPRTNIGKLDDIKIEAGSVSSKQSENITIYSRYKMFYGVIDAITQDNYNIPESIKFKSKEDVMLLNSMWINDGLTEIASIETTNDKPSFVIIIPKDLYKITSTKSTLGNEVSIDSTWYFQNSFTYQASNTSTEYSVYVLPSTEKIIYKEIKINKK